MWDAIVSTVESGQGWLLLAIIVMMAITARMGHLKVKTDKLMIGKDSGDNERLLMKKQTEYAYVTCMGFEKQIPRFDGYNPILGELIVEKVYDEIVSWVMINHIEDSAEYIKNKQKIVWNIVSTETINKKMKNEKFKAQVYDCIEEIIKELVHIRNNHREGEE
jgi:hypothetical protein